MVKAASMPMRASILRSRSSIARDVHAFGRSISERGCGLVKLVLTFGGTNTMRRNRAEWHHDEGALCSVAGFHDQSRGLCQPWRAAFPKLHRRWPSRRQLSNPRALHIWASRSATDSVIDDRFARAGNRQNCFGKGRATILGALVRQWRWRQADAAGSQVRLFPKRAHARIGSRVRGIRAKLLAR